MDIEPVTIAYDSDDMTTAYLAGVERGRDASAAEITALRKRVEESEGALEQFVPAYQSWMDKFPDHDNSGVYQRVTWGQIRRARALLCAKGGEHGE